MYCAIPVVAGGFFSSIYNVPCQAEYYHEKTKIIAVSTASAAVLNIVLNAIFIMKYGYIAAAYTTLFTYFAYYTIHYLVAWKIEGKKVFPCGVVVVYSIVIALSMIASIVFVNNALVRILVLIVIMGTTIYHEEKQYAVIITWLKQRGYLN